eukprot:1540420-Prymnesium_polylepis.1
MFGRCGMTWARVCCMTQQHGPGRPPSSARTPQKQVPPSHIESCRTHTTYTFRAAHIACELAVWAHSAEVLPSLRWDMADLP